MFDVHEFNYAIFSLIKDGTLGALGIASLEPIQNALGLIIV